MMKNYLTIISVFVLLLMPAGVVLAEEDVASPKQTEDQGEEQQVLEIDPLVKAQEDSIENTYGILKDLMKALQSQEQNHLFMAYNNYNLIGTVRVVQKDVKNAVEGCSKNNPDIEDRIRTRFKTWNEAIDPILEEAQGNLDNMIIAQDYVKKEDVEALFASVDKTRERSDARIDKIPVTTLEACEFLLGKMDETEDSMLGLLRSTLVSFPQAFPSTEPAGSEPSDDEAEL